jgi:hypothetical protein
VDQSEFASASAAISSSSQTRSDTLVLMCCQILHKVISDAAVAQANHPRRDEFGVGIKGADLPGSPAMRVSSSNMSICSTGWRLIPADGGAIPCTAIRWEIR